MNFRVADLNLKVVQHLTERQALTLRTSYYDEDSQVTYSGLTLAEWRGRPARQPVQQRPHVRVPLGHLGHASASS